MWAEASASRAGGMESEAAGGGMGKSDHGPNPVSLPTAPSPGSQGPSRPGP